MEINKIEKISETLSKTIKTQHDEYEKYHGVCCNYTPFFFSASEGKEIYGVISGYTCYSEIYIDDFIVFAPYRNKGVGRKLIQAVEQHFSGKSFNNINLVTSAFQAPQFYEKCGFTLEFIRENLSNPLLSKHFYVKFLDS
jgi:GNAT superfamily N-acetyltransferase